MASPTSTRRAERKAETRARVLGSALALFAELGFEATSTASIAKRAGVAHGTVFTIAPTKERLAFEACRDRLLEIGAQALATACATAGMLADRLEHIFQALYDFYARNPELSRVLVKQQIFLDHPGDPAGLEQLLQDYFNGLGLLVGEAQKAGEIRKDTNVPDLVAGIFGIYLLFLLALLRGDYGTREVHRLACRGALDTLLAGSLRRRPGR